jgi:adenylate kinase family enzyme
MEPKTFIFIGRSGCGKGTQVDLLIKYLKERSPNPVFYMESGEKFREFVSQSSHTADLAKKIMEAGGLQPAFLAIHIWSHLFIEQMLPDKHLIIDGTPRKLDEAKILDEALGFYGRNNVFVVYMNVGRKWATDRLTGRGRADDIKAEDIEKRLNWFDTDVMPAVEHLKASPRFRFLDINGEQTIEEVHNEIMAKIGFKS